MAFGEVTGGTEADIERLEHEYYRSPKFKKTGIPFEESYCLFKIGRQPEDYDGPQRICKRRATKDSTWCPFHQRSPTLENLDKTASLKHSMYALPQTIYETLTDEETELYEWVFTWPEVYGIDLSDDPSSEHSFETLAIEIVRQARSSDYILSNTEVTREGVYTAQGELLEQKVVPNRLIKEHQSQIRLIETIKDALGITRKAQSRDEQAESATTLMDSISGVVAEMTKGYDYDPDRFDSTE